jgi:hypothetical protein
MSFSPKKSVVQPAALKRFKYRRMVWFGSRGKYKAPRGNRPFSALPGKRKVPYALGGWTLDT